MEDSKRDLDTLRWRSWYMKIIHCSSQQPWLWEPTQQSLILLVAWIYFYHAKIRTQHLRVQPLLSFTFWMIFSQIGLGLSRLTQMLIYDEERRRADSKNVLFVVKLFLIIYLTFWCCFLKKEIIIYLVWFLHFLHIEKTRISSATEVFFNDTVKYRCKD